MLRCAVKLSIQYLENASNDQLSLQLLHATKTLVLIDLYERLLAHPSKYTVCINAHL